MANPKKFEEVLAAYAPLQPAAIYKRIQALIHANRSVSASVIETSSRKDEDADTDDKKGGYESEFSPTSP